MVQFGALLLSIALALATASATGGGDHGGGDDTEACPQGFKLKHVTGFQWGGCECIDDFHKSTPLKQGWSVSTFTDKKGGVECRPKCDKPPKPTPSGTPGHGGHGENHGGHGGDHGGHGGDQGHGGHGGGVGGPQGGQDQEHGGQNGHGHLKRRQQQSIELCPASSIACPVNVAGFVATEVDYECVHAEEDIDNCGACGNSCTSAAGVKGTACVAGTCEVYSCAPGFQIATLTSGASGCVPSL